MKLITWKAKLSWDKRNKQGRIDHKMSDDKESKDQEKKQSKLESIGKMVAIFAAIVTAILGVIQLRRSVDQSAEELRWKRAGLAREMINKMVEDDGWQAMEMLDWEEIGTEFEIKKGQKARISANDVYSALDINKKEKDLKEKDRFIRYRFDRLFFLVSQLQSAVESQLIKIEDVRFPLDWYAANRICVRKPLFEAYMRETTAPETLKFFRSLREWNECK